MKSLFAGALPHLAHFGEQSLDFRGDQHGSEDCQNRLMCASLQKVYEPLEEAQPSRGGEQRASFALTVWVLGNQLFKPMLEIVNGF